MQGTDSNRNPNETGKAELDASIDIFLSTGEFHSLTSSLNLNRN